MFTSADHQGGLSVNNVIANVLPIMTEERASFSWNTSVLACEHLDRLY